jgi:hypothetical protein
VVQIPRLSVSEHAYVALTKFICALSDIPRKLLNSVRQHRWGSQRLLHLDRGTPSLHIDSPAAACLSLKGDIYEIGAAKIERRIKQELPNIRLNVGLSTAR